MKDNTPLPFVFKSCSLEPSAAGRVNTVEVSAKSSGAIKVILSVPLSEFSNNCIAPLAVLPFETLKVENAPVAAAVAPILVPSIAPPSISTVSLF